MKKAIILHGIPTKENYYYAEGDSPSNCNWSPWLQQQLIVRDILAQTPEMPRPYEPDYQAWKEIFEELKPDSETVVIAHSGGGGFLARWLSESSTTIDRAILVAPWIDPDRTLATDFFKFDVSPDLCKKTKRGIVIFESEDDSPYIHDSIKIIRMANPNITCREFRNMGHFNLRGMKTREFPELLEEVLK